MDKKFSDLIPLVIFTSFMTVAAGLMCGITFIELFEPEMVFRFSNLHIITGISVAGFSASFLHLAKKVRAVKAVTGVKTSWLSREIIFGSAFMISLFFIYFNQYSELGLSNHLLFPIVTLFALLTVFSVGMVYNLPAQIAWKGSLNLYSPFLSALLLAVTYYQSQIASSYLPVIILLCADFYFFTKRYKLLLSKKNMRIFHFPHLIIPSVVYLQIRGIITILLLPLLLILGFVPFYLVGVLVVIDRITFYSSAIQISPDCGVAQVREQILRQAKI